ncbi:hypothetical protein QYE76_063250 [Lolium multiflorum]|uniref:Uncharacterized protein n=1 Tax=Lolium multiflorum TaxID=4521 RepID=A0AAD8S5B7_LOLMU|nr:hypothetical protein QYE76_063250 [Lolium multiflorum]
MLVPVLTSSPQLLMRKPNEILQSIELAMKPKVEFLLRTMKKTLKAIVEYPRYFSYSLEEKIKPWFWVIKGRKIDCSMADMFSENGEVFVEEYYLEIETLPVAPSLQSSKGIMCVLSTKGQCVWPLGDIVWHFIWGINGDATAGFAGLARQRVQGVAFSS